MFSDSRFPEPRVVYAEHEARRMAEARERAEIIAKATGQTPSKSVLKRIAIMATEWGDASE